MNKNTYFKILTNIILLFWFLLTISSIFIDESFLLIFSADNHIEQTTLDKLFIFRLSLLITGFIFLFIYFQLHFNKSKVSQWLNKNMHLMGNILLLVLIIAGLLIIGEIVARILLHDTKGIWSEDLTNLKYYQLNERGMRGEVYSLEKPLNTYRIALIGDSYAFGAGVKNVNDTFANLLEQKLNSSNKNIEVINFGIAGYSMQDYFDTINNKAINYNPDLIILSLVYNDFITQDTYLNYRNENPYKEIPYISIWLRSSSNLYCYLEIKFNQFMELTGIRPKFSDLLNKSYNSEIDKKINRQKISELIALSEKNNISVIILTFPVPSNFRDYKFNSWEDFVSEVGKENNVNVINMIDTFKYYDLKDITVSQYDLHPNEKGHKLVADMLFETLKGSHSSTL